MLEITKQKWQVKTFEVGEQITNDANSLWFIKQGAVKISTYDSDGKIVVLGYWGKKDVVGQPLSKIAPYKIECLTLVEADCVPSQDWHYITKEIRNCYQDAEKLLYILKQNSVEEKLIELLVYLGGKFGSVRENKTAILLPLTHRELAEFFGVTRATIVAAMNRLQSRKILDNPRQGTVILHTSEIETLKYKIQLFKI